MVVAQSHSQSSSICAARVVHLIIIIKYWKAPPTCEFNKATAVYISREGGPTGKSSSAHALYCVWGGRSKILPLDPFRGISLGTRMATLR